MQATDLDTLTVREIKAQREVFEVELKALLERFTANTGCIITYIDLDYDDTTKPPSYLKVEIDVKVAP